MRISDWSSDVCSSDLILGRAQCERHIFRRPARDAIAVGDMVGGSRSDDDMIKYFHVERPANLIELAGDRDILIARARVAARMIVDENDRSGIEFERAPERWEEGRVGKGGGSRLN